MGGEALLLKTAKNGCSCLHSACYHGHLEIAKVLIEAGGEALLLKTEKDGCSCLYSACLQGHLEIAKALIKASGDVAARAAFLLMLNISNSCSCLHVASISGHVTVVVFLLSCPGLVDLRDRSGRTALELAVAAGQTAAAEAIRAASGRPAPPRPS